VHARLTRGRPGYKNDNRFVEQKNDSLRRAASTTRGLGRIGRPQDSAAIPLQRLRRAKPPLARETAERRQTLHHHTDPR